MQSLKTFSATPLFGTLRQISQLSNSELTQYIDDYYRGLYKALTKSDAKDSLQVEL